MSQKLQTLTLYMPDGTERDFVSGAVIGCGLVPGSSCPYVDIRIMDLAGNPTTRFHRYIGIAHSLEMEESTVEVVKPGMVKLI